MDSNKDGTAKPFDAAHGSAACDLCRGAGLTDGALGFNGQGPCPRCRPETWGPYARRGDWYVLTSPDDNRTDVGP